jgi:hypothetical protein
MPVGSSFPSSLLFAKAAPGFPLFLSPLLPSLDFYFRQPPVSPFPERESLFITAGKPDDLCAARTRQSHSQRLSPIRVSCRPASQSALKFPSLASPTPQPVNGRIPILAEAFFHRKAGFQQLASLEAESESFFAGHFHRQDRWFPLTSHNHQLSWWLELALEGPDTGRRLKTHRKFFRLHQLPHRP